MAINAIKKDDIVEEVFEIVQVNEKVKIDKRFKTEKADIIDQLDRSNKTEE